MDKLLRNKKQVLAITILAAIVIAVIVPLAIWGINNLPSNLYNRTLAALENDDTGRARYLAAKLDDNYKDAKQLKPYAEARYLEAPTKTPDGLGVGSNPHLDEAYNMYIRLGDYKDSAERAKAAGYEYVSNSINNSSSIAFYMLESAEKVVSSLVNHYGYFQDLDTMSNQINEIMHEARYNEALKQFEGIDSTNTDESIIYICQNAAEILGTTYSQLVGCKA